MLLFLLLVLSVALIGWNWFKYLTVWRYIERLPGPQSLPIIGNVHQIGNNPKEYLKSLLNWWKFYNNDIFRIYVGSFPYVIISNPKDIEAVLSSNTLLQKGDVYDLLRPWLGDGLLTSHGVKWHKHRKMITPSFHFKILTEFLDIINENSNKFAQKLEEKANNKKIFDIQEMIHYCTLDIICETAMGINLNSIDNPKSEVVTAIQDICYTIQNAAFNPIKRNPFTYKFTSDYWKQRKALNIFKNFTHKVIEKRRKIITEMKEIENCDATGQQNSNDTSISGMKQKKAFLDTLLTATIDGCPLTSADIFEEVSTFMFEGHDTTTSGIAFSVYLLSRHQDIQESIYEEQKNIFGNDMKRNPSYQEIQDMKYLDLLIKETQRLYPSVPIIARFCDDDFNLNGKKIPKNSTIVLFILAMGYNEKYFEDPYTVNVYRFDPTKREKLNPFEYVPFSAGPRNCIGQKFAVLEMKSILSSIVRRFEILPPDLVVHNGINKEETDDQGTPILASVLTLKSENGIQIKLRKRTIK